MVIALLTMGGGAHVSLVWTSDERKCIHIKKRARAVDDDADLTAWYMTTLGAFGNNKKQVGGITADQLRGKMMCDKNTIYFVTTPPKKKGGVGGGGPPFVESRSVGLDVLGYAGKKGKVGVCVIDPESRDVRVCLYSPVLVPGKEGEKTTTWIKSAMGVY
jgi:hypothetical protein